jgi:CheY-like chemotaxis protein
MLSGNQTILVVDDERDIVESVKLWLEKRGLNVHEFSDPLLALEYFKNNASSISVASMDQKG